MASPLEALERAVDEVDALEAIFGYDEGGFTVHSAAELCCRLTETTTRSFVALRSKLPMCTSRAGTPAAAAKPALRSAATEVDCADVELLCRSHTLYTWHNAGAAPLLPTSSPSRKKIRGGRWKLVISCRSIL